MKCSVCGHENASDARFCAQCGSALGITCPVCATRNTPGSRFCTSCGTNLAEAPRAGASDDIARYVPEELLRKIRAARAGGTMRGERRTVTMLFADVQGSTAAAEHLDPEDWAEIMNGAFQHLIAPVYRYEGTLAHLQGDAVLAFFGAPIAHEDDPVRAVRAGLEIAEAFEGYRTDVSSKFDVPIGVRVGINTGLVVVGEVGSDLRVEYTALGDAINVAARMEQTADPGTVRVTRHTAELLGDLFDLVEIGAVEVKGKVDPVVAFRVTGLATALPPGPGAQPDAAPLVGRERERSTLGSVVAGVLRGRGSICSLVGEAGIGKSRLVATARADAAERHTVVERAGEATGGLAWLEGRCRSFDAGIPYALFADVLRRWWALGDGPAADLHRIAAAVEGATGSPDPDAASLLATAVGVPLPEGHDELVTSLATPVLHQRTTEAIVAYLAAEAARRPVALVLEDVHWSDALSLALAERLLPLTETSALAVVLVLRPYRDDPSWRLIETAERDFAHRYTAVHLDALPEEATSALVGQLTVGTTVDEAISRRILERANGNPLFVEQLVRSLGDAPPEGAGLERQVDVPASLTGLLTARLDMLGDDRRLVAQVASVIGQEFDEDALAALLPGYPDLGTTLSELVRRGILVERPHHGGRRYAFDHALIEETAYSTVLLRTRRELHARLAGHLEATDPDAVQEISRHLVAAGDRKRAFPYLVAAGERATRVMALTDAIRMFTTALDAVPAEADEDLVVRAHSGLGEAYGLIPDLPQVTATYQRLFDYGRECGQPSVQVLALNRLGMATAEHTGDIAAAERYLAEARRLAEASGDQLGLAEYHSNACFLAASQGELERAIAHDHETARLGERENRPRLRLAGLIRGAFNLLAATRYDEAQQLIDEAIQSAETIGAAKELLVLRAYRTTYWAMRDGDLATARLASEQALPELARLGSAYAPPLQSQATSTALALGDVEGAITQAGEARRVAEQAGHGFAVAAAAAFLGHAYAVCGKEELTAVERNAALAALQSPFGEFLASTVWADLAWANLLLGAYDQAAEDLTVGLEVSSTTRYWQRPRLLLGSAHVALARADTAAARRHLDDADTFVAERGIRYYDPDLALAEGRLALADGRSSDAVAAFERAQSLAADRGQRLLERDVAIARHELATVLGLPDEAAAHAEHGRRITEEIASTIADEDLRAGFRGWFEGAVGGPTLLGPVS